MTPMQVLQRAVPTLVRLIGDALDLKFEFGSPKAMTDGSTVYLPTVDNPEMLLGYAAHEGFHNCYTDFELLQAERASGLTDFEKRLHNAIEDPWIEEAGFDLWPGARDWIDTTITELAKENALVATGQELQPGELLCQYTMLKLRAEMNGYTAAQQLLPGLRDQVLQTFPETAVTRLEGLLTNVPSIRSTAEALSLTKRIAKMIEDEVTPEDEAESQDSEPQSGDSQAEQSQPSHLSSEKEKRNNLQQALNARPDELGEGTFEQLAQELENQAGANPMPSPPLPTEVVKAVPDGDRVQQLRATSMALESRLHGLLEAQRRDVTRSPALTGRRLLRSRLHRLAVGDGRVFRSRGTKSQVDAAVYLLLDNSSSMRKRIDLASDALLTTALALERIQGADVMASAFPGTGKDLQVLTGRGERVAATAGRYALSAIGGTPLAEALWHPIYELTRCRQSRRILMVFTDGEPNNWRQARDLLDVMVAAGIVCVGVGINTMTVQQLFPIHRVIDTLDELPGLALDLAGQVLARAAA